MMRLRVISSIDDAMRTAMRGMGDLSTQVEEAIRKTNLNTVKLVDFKAEGGTARDTTVSVDTKVHEKLANASDQRGASMNVLVNSALASLFRIPVRLRGRVEDSQEQLLVIRK